MTTEKISTVSVVCGWCGNKVRIRLDGRLRKHKLPKPTSWSRGPQPYCHGSETYEHQHAERVK